MSSETEKTVRVRVAVLIDSDGEYSAVGSSRFEPGTDREMLDQLLDEHENVGNGLRGGALEHVKFLEIDLPLPSSRPVNLEAQPESRRHPPTAVSDGPPLREED